MVVTGSLDRMEFIAENPWEVECLQRLRHGPLHVYWGDRCEPYVGQAVIVNTSFAEKLPSAVNTTADNGPPVRGWEDADEEPLDDGCDGPECPEPLHLDPLMWQLALEKGVVTDDEFRRALGLGPKEVEKPKVEKPKVEMGARSIRVVTQVEIEGATIALTVQDLLFRDGQLAEMSPPMTMRHPTRPGRY